MLGRSMGGGVTLNALVVQPDLVEAAVIYASVSCASSTTCGTSPRPAGRTPTRHARAVRHAGEEPRFYRELSSRTFSDRISDRC